MLLKPRPAAVFCKTSHFLGLYSKIHLIKNCQKKILSFQMVICITKY